MEDIHEKNGKLWKFAKKHVPSEEVEDGYPCRESGFHLAISGIEQYTLQFLAAKVIEHAGEISKNCALVAAEMQGMHT